MRSTSALALTVFAAVLITGSAHADDRVHVTPPLYREQARATQQVRHVSDLTTTPQPVATASSLKAEPLKAASEVVALAR
jgi:hypothetical protein